MKTTHHFTLEEVKENLRSYCGLSSDEEIVIEGIDDIQKGPFITLRNYVECWFLGIDCARRSQYWGLIKDIYEGIEESEYDYFGKGFAGQNIYCSAIDTKYYISPDEWYKNIYCKIDKKPE